MDPTAVPSSIDENLPPKLGRLVGSVYQPDDFKVPVAECLSGWSDVDLFAELGKRGFDAIITQDDRQLDRLDGRTALRDSGLHWIGIDKLSVAGPARIAVQVSIVMAGLGWVEDCWAPVPTAYRLAGPRRYEDVKLHMEE